MLNAPRHKNEGVHRSGEGGRRAHYVTQWLISVTEGRESESRAVSYTHLTLPTIYSV